MEIYSEIEVELDALYADEVTCFVGRATAWAVYRHGTNMIKLENKVGEKWVEDSRLRFVRGE